MNAAQRNKEALHLRVANGNPGEIRVEPRKKNPLGRYYGEKALARKCP